MPPPEYRLEIVLEQREKKKKDCQQALIDAEKALVEEKKKLAALQEARRQVDVRKAKAADEFNQALMRPGTNIAEEADRHDWYQKAQDAEAARIEGEIAKQKQQVRRAEGRVADAQLELQKASIDLEALQKHKEKWLKQIKREADEKEQNAQEELGEVMWLQQLRDEQSRGQQAQKGF
jgi:hypothetical protein